MDSPEENLSFVRNPATKIALLTLEAQSKRSSNSFEAEDVLNLKQNQQISNALLLEVEKLIKSSQQDIIAKLTEQNTQLQKELANSRNEPNKKPISKVNAASKVSVKPSFKQPADKNNFKPAFETSPGRSVKSNPLHSSSSVTNLRPNTKRTVNTKVQSKVTSSRSQQHNQPIVAVNNKTIEHVTNVPISPSSHSTEKSFGHKLNVTKQFASVDSTQTDLSDASTRSCVSSPSSVTHNDNGWPDAEQDSALFRRQREEFQKLQVEYARVRKELDEYKKPVLVVNGDIAQHSSSANNECDKVVVNNEPPEEDDKKHFKEEIIRLRDELSTCKKMYAEESNEFKGKEYNYKTHIESLNNKIFQLTEEISNKNKIINDLNIKLDVSKAAEKESSEVNDFLQAERDSQFESFKECDEQRKQLQQAFFKSNDECLALNDTISRLTSLNSCLQKVIDDAEEVALYCSSELLKLKEHTDQAFESPTSLVNEIIGVKNVSKNSDAAIDENAIQLNQGLELKDFKIGVTLNEIKSSVLKVSDELKSLRQEIDVNREDLQKERACVMAILSELCSYKHSIENSEQQPPSTIEMPKELSAWVDEYMSSIKQNKNISKIETPVELNINEEETKHFFQMFTQQTEIARLQDELKKANLQNTELLAKYSHHTSILIGNVAKSDEEIKQLDLIMDNIFETFKKIPSVVMSCNELKLLWCTLAGDQFPNIKK